MRWSKPDSVVSLSPDHHINLGDARQAARHARLTFDTLVYLGGEVCRRITLREERAVGTPERKHRPGALIISGLHRERRPGSEALAPRFAIRAKSEFPNGYRKPRCVRCGEIRSPEARHYLSVTPTSSSCLADEHPLVAGLDESGRGTGADVGTPAIVELEREADPIRIRRPVAERHAAEQGPLDLISNDPLPNQPRTRRIYRNHGCSAVCSKHGKGNLRMEPRGAECEQSDGDRTAHAVSGRPAHGHRSLEVRGAGGREPTERSRNSSSTKLRGRLIPDCYCVSPICPDK